MIKTYKTRATHLLTGILSTTDGTAWHGNGAFYRTGTKAIKASRVDDAVISHLMNDLQSEGFVHAVVKAAQQYAPKRADIPNLESGQKEIRAIDAKIDRLSNLLSETTAAAPLLRKIEALERERSAIVQQAETAEASASYTQALRQIGEQDVKAILGNLADNISEADRDDLKEILRGLIDRIAYDYSSSDCCIYYKIPVKTGELVASPTRFELVLSP